MNKKRRQNCFCINCGKEFYPKFGTTGKYCSNKCQQEFEYKEYIRKWKIGIESGTIAKISYSKYIRKYLFEKYNSKCSVCGWSKVNPFTNKVPLQIHHIDGNCVNNKEENLQLLCPNCHSLTENFGRRNKNANPERSKYYKKA